MNAAPTLVPGPRDAITDVRGVRVGHWTSRRAATGCTVVLCESCEAAAADVRGGAPATHETDALASGNLVRRCHAVVLTGGSAFGLAATAGVARWLAARGVGVETSSGPVPVVAGAAILDLATGRRAFPGPDEGERAASRASRGTVARGSAGAGAGATVAKLTGMERALKGGLGAASLAEPGGFVVGAIAAVNAVGAVLDPDTGALLAGPRGDRPGEMRAPGAAALERDAAEIALDGRSGTTLVCVAANAAIGHEGARRLAVHAHDGLARAILPAHTIGDGDVAFAIATGERPAGDRDLALLGLMATLAVGRAVADGVERADGLGGVPSARDWRERAR